MALFKDLYKIESKKSTKKAIRARLSLNGRHSIYQGHFPSQPVTPGVCLIEMARELIQQETEQEWQFYGAANIKFLTMVIPEADEYIDLKIDMNYLSKEHLEANVLMMYKGKTATKFKGIYKSAGKNP